MVKLNVISNYLIILQQCKEPYDKILIDVMADTIDFINSINGQAHAEVKSYIKSKLPVIWSCTGLLLTN